MTQSNAANKATGRRFRHATMRDLPQMQKIYARARALMAANGNPTQWGNEFPRESVIEDDIANQRTMLLVDTCASPHPVWCATRPATASGGP